MKTTFNNQEVCHLWAHQKQSYGKGSNVFFEGKTIYSYGYHFPMATFFKDVLMVNSSSYSVTTSRHQSDLEFAISHKYKIRVPKLIFQDDSTNEKKSKHKANLKYFEDNIKEQLFRHKQPT